MTGSNSLPHPSDDHRFLAPARVNLLGEHTDYTGGFVLPMAIPFYNRATVTPAESGYSFSSALFETTRAITAEDRSPRARNWTDYPVGVLRQLQQRGIEPPPFHLHLSGNVPFGAGVSSSASVEIVTAYALLAFTGTRLKLEEIAVLCRAAENEYVGSPCGIMDQFSIAAAKAGHALLLNTRTLHYEHLPMNQGALAATQIVVCNSMVKHSIASGEYGIRHKQVMDGQAAMQRKFAGLADLGDATLQQLEQARGEMSHESYLRCRHIVSDNARVMLAKDAMFAGDPVSLGRLMLEGHASERDDFACSCDEVDFLVDTAASLPGCFGARLTGGGFGGCTVNLVDRNQSEAFSAALRKAYQEKYDIAADVFVCDAVDGAEIRNSTEQV
ncbi:galactokinase [Granulicella paludicola]|uniref:galactokinase n=1 Tax=Granulicella paludicola TaxID=474951 RepID=UPI0021DF43CC|nr:galactokinase [Granulicella paludicola]